MTRSDAFFAISITGRHNDPVPWRVIYTHRLTVGSGYLFRDDSQPADMTMPGQQPVVKV
jgi:hypothetical protein